MNVQTVLHDIELLAADRDLPIIGPKKGTVLVELVKKHKPLSVLEVGTLIGYSTILMAENLPPKGKVTTIEINNDFAEEARKNIKRAGFADRVTVVIGNALNVMPTLHGPFELLFLDAAKDEYRLYLFSTEPRLSSSAIVVADNAKIFAEAMADYLEYVRSSGRYKSTTVDFGFDAVEVSERVP